MKLRRTFAVLRNLRALPRINHSNWRDVAIVAKQIAVVCAAAALFFSASAFAGEPVSDFALNADIAEQWTFELTLTPIGASNTSASAVDDLLAKISRASGASFEFARKTAAGTLVFTVPEVLTASQVLGIRKRVASVDEVDSIQTRRLSPSSSKRSKAAGTPETSAALSAVGFIIKPRPDADLGGWVDARGLTPLALAKFEDLTAMTFAGSSAMAGGMIVLRLVQPLSGDEVSRVQAALASAQFVEWVEPDTLVEASRVPNDTFYSNQWNLWGAWGINAQAAWDLTIGSPSVVVAVLDTGILKTQPDLSSRILPGYDFISDPASARDGNGWDSDASDQGDWREVGDCGQSTFRPSSWHGSHVAGIVGAASDNSYGVAGVAWGIRILPVRVLGRCGGASSDIISGMYWAAGLAVPGAPANPNPARIINMSLGSQTPKQTCSSSYQTAVNAVRAAGAMIVVAAGNNGNTPFGEAGYYEPSGCPGVIAVGATDHLGYRASYSNYSTEFVVDLSAPGGDISYYNDVTKGIYSTVDKGLRTPEGPWGVYYQGTSQATPHVSGILALMLSANPTLTNNQLYYTLIETAGEFNPASGCYRDSVCGWGIANAHAAVLRAQRDPANAPTNISITSSANPAIQGQPFTISVSVVPTNVTGTVTFMNGDTPLTGCTNLPLTQGRTGCTFTGWSANPTGYALTAWFNGDETHHWDYDSLTQVVLPSNSNINYQGMWYTPGEGGWGINFTHQGDILFASWFTYDVYGKPLWVSMTAQQQSDGSFTGPLDFTSGPPFSAVPYDSTHVTHNTVGTGRVTFSDANNGTFSHNLNGIQRVKPLARFVFAAPVPVCTFSGALTAAQALNYTDMWAVPNLAEAGWGINFTHQGDVIFVSWFIYDQNGASFWVSATLTKTGTRTYTGALDMTTGSPFSAVPYNPSLVTHTTVGAASIVFADGNNGTFTYTLNGVSRTKALTRFVFRAPGTVCQ